MGYGITSGSFNFTSSLFYLPNTFSVGSGITLKNTWGAQLQPGFHIPLNSPNFRALLLYGTLGYAATNASTSIPQSDILCTPEIRRNGLTASNRASYYASNCNSPPLISAGVNGETARFPAEGNSRSKLNGLVLGVGAKLAFSERVYGVFDFTYILYRKLENDFHQAMQIDRRDLPYIVDVNNSNSNGNADYRGTWTRDYSASGIRIRQSFLFIGAGFRFF